MSYLKLNVEQYREITRERDPNERWDGDDTRSSWEINGVELVDDNTYQTVKNYLDAKVGDRIWVVYAVYSTGDSFGHDEDGQFEFVNVFATQADAEKCAEILVKATEKAEYVLSDGTKVGYGWIPWRGYFESLSYIRAEEFVVGGGKKTWYPKR